MRISLLFITFYDTMSMERAPRIEIPDVPDNEFAFSGEDIELNEASKNPEAYPGCLVGAMKAANRGSSEMSQEVMTTVVASRDRDLAMACGRCGITLIRDAGVVYGARKCPLVRIGQETLGELA